MADITKLKVSGATYDIKDAAARTHIADSAVHVTSAQKESWTAKQDALKVGGTTAVGTTVDASPTAGHASALVTSGGVATAIAGVSEEVGGKLDKADVVGPDASATVGQAADAKHTYDALQNKVDKETGKGLSANDYTDDEKAEVAKVKDKADEFTEWTFSGDGDVSGLSLKWEINTSVEPHVASWVLLRDSGYVGEKLAPEDSVSLVFTGGAEWGGNFDLTATRNKVLYAGDVYSNAEVDAAIAGHHDGTKLDKTAVVAPTSTATVGQAADAKHTYDELAAIKSAIAGGTIFLGVTRTAITDGGTIGSIEVKDGSSWKTIPAADIKDGNFVIYEKTGTNGLEFIAAQGKWYELGSSGTLKALAFKDTASASYTPAGDVEVGSATAAGDVSQPTFSGTKITGLGTTFTGTEGDVSASFTPAGTIAGTVTGTTSTTIPDYTPEGTVEGTVTGTANVTINQVSVNTQSASATANTAFASATYDTPNETLEFNSSSFLTGFAVTPTVASATTSTTVNATNKLTFTGTKKVSSTVSGTCSVAVDAANKLTFTGSNGTATGKFTPEATVTVNDFTPAGTVSKPTFTGTAHTHAATFAGTGATITVS